MPLRDTFVATFNETCAPTSRIYVAEQGKAMLNLSKTFQNLWLHSSVFGYKKTLKSYILRVFLPLRDTLVATFNERRAPTSRIYIAEKDTVMPN